MGDLTNTLDVLRSMSVPSAASLMDSIKRMRPIVTLACNPGTVENEYKVKKSITLEQRNSLLYQLQRFIQVSLSAYETLAFCGDYGIAPTLLDVGESYQIIMEIVTPWKVIWENMHNTMMYECLPHPKYGFPVKIDLTDLEEPESGGAFVWL